MVRIRLQLDVPLESGVGRWGWEKETNSQPSYVPWFCVMRTGRHKVEERKGYGKLRQGPLSG